ncbi:MAG TPA: hypothetical protein VIE65_12885 [Methylobacter sp.]|jgi:type IV secretion system protein VirB4
MEIVPEAQALAKNEVPMARYIKQDFHVSQYAVRTIDKSYQTLFKVDGVTFDTLGEDKIDAYHRLLVTWLNTSLNGGEFRVYRHCVRRKMDMRLSGNYNNDFSEIVANQYYDTFAGMRMLQTELYLIVEYKPKIDAVTRKIMGNMSRKRLKAFENEQIEKLEGAAEQTKRTLKEFDLTRMGMYEKEGVVYSQFKDFLGFMVNGEWVELPLTKKPMHKQVAYAKNAFRGEYRSITTAKGRKYAAYFDLVDYPEEYDTGALDKLLFANFEFVETMGFRPTNMVDGRARLEKMEAHVYSAGDVTEKEIEDFESIKEKQKDGELVFGDFQYSIGVFGDTWEELKRNKAEFFGILASTGGFKTAPIETVSACGFFMQLPGNWDAAPREAFISDSAFFGMACLHNFGSGKLKGNPWGDAVTILKTPSLQPYCFNFHATPEETDNEDDKAPGNTTIIGMTGSGKTVLEAFLCCNLMKVPNIRLVCFDLDRGLEPFVRRIGGQYSTLQVGKKTGWNLFQGFPDSPSYRAHVKEVLREAISEFGTISIQEDMLLEQGIQAVFKMPKELRGITTLLQNIPEVGTQLANKLRPWAVGDDGRDAGVNSWVFDCEVDTLDLQSRNVYGFDYTEILDYPKVCAPVLMHLLYRINSMLDGRPFVYVMAEFWKALENKIFTDFAKKGQKTIRKLNGLGIFDTQEPADMVKSTIGGPMVQQSATKIFLPNPEAVWEDYQTMGCTEREFEIIKYEMHPSSRQFIIKQGHGSVRAMLDLGGMDECLDILSGSKDNVEILEAIIEQVGEKPKDWVGLYHDMIAKRRGKFMPNKFDFRDLGEELFTVGEV